MALPRRRFHSFIMRIWFEEDGTPPQAYAQSLRGMIRNVDSGETRFFSHWKDLAAFVDAQVAPPKKSDGPPPAAGA